MKEVSKYTLKEPSKLFKGISNLIYKENKTLTNSLQNAVFVVNCKQGDLYVYWK